MSAECPYFFEIHDLIAQCPNQMPTGLGGAISMIEEDILGTGTGPDDADGQKDTGEMGDGAGEPGHSEHDLEDDFEGTGSEAGDPEVGEDEDGDAYGDRGSEDGINTDVVDTKTPQKHKAKSTPPTASALLKKSKKTPACPNTLTSITQTPSNGKPGKLKGLQGVINFEHLAKDEETTHQKELELAKEKIRYNSTVVKAKYGLKLKREENQFELQCLELLA
ncbi:hypothetical protein C8T65DRAFT_737611 [Cerioporus squamosus]|nr:hypothetical protein C8T65DRAFT_737611 [Cerioporus squamosus]